MGGERGGVSPLNPPICFRMSEETTAVCKFLLIQRVQSVLFENLSPFSKVLVSIDNGAGEGAWRLAYAYSHETHSVNCWQDLGSPHVIGGDALLPETHMSYLLRAPFFPS